MVVTLFEDTFNSEAPLKIFSRQHINFSLNRHKHTQRLLIFRLKSPKIHKKYSPEFYLQIPYNERYITALPRNTSRSRGRSYQDGSESSPKIEFQAIASRSKDRSPRSNALKHRRCTTDMSQR